MTPEIRFGVFCEHARAEHDGRSTLIGLFGSKYRIPANPGATLIALAVHFSILFPDAGENRAELVIDVPGKSPAMTVPLQFKVEPDLLSGHLNVNFGLQITEPGTAVARLEIFSDPPVSHEVEMEIEFVPPPVLDQVSQEG